MAFQRFGGYRKCRHECSLGVNLVFDNLVIELQILCIFENNRTITYGDIAFKRFRGYSVSFGCERSCSSARRVSNYQRTSGGIYPNIKFERNMIELNLKEI